MRKARNYRVKPDWRDRAEAAEILGSGYSIASMKRKVSSGEWIEGIHYSRPSPRSIKVNVAQVQADWSLSI